MNFCAKVDNMHVREKIGLGATSIDPVCIKELEEDETEEHHFVEAYIVQKDVREEYVVA